jgi:protein-disulfide isomerase
MLNGGDTVSATEKKYERIASVHSPKLSNASGTPKKVAIGRVENFTCPACNQNLEEAISINGRVKGWCGTTHTLINVEAPK